MCTEPPDGFYVLLYLLVDENGCFPQAHGLYNNWKDAETARKSKINPNDYHSVRVRFVKGWLAKAEGIPDQNV